MLKNIKKANMTQQVIEQFKQQILDGSWRVGERIPSENELAQTLGVSRSTVRQALRSLSDYGLLDIRLGSGSYVKKPESGEIMKAILPTVIFQKEDMREALDFCCIFLHISTSAHIISAIIAADILCCRCLCFLRHTGGIGTQVCDQTNSSAAFDIHTFV